jgi:hypothetical protein
LLYKEVFKNGKLITRKDILALVRDAEDPYKRNICVL